jgi:hypothetical protein
MAYVQHSVWHANTGRHSLCGAGVASDFSKYGIGVDLYFKFVVRTSSTVRVVLHSSTLLIVPWCCDHSHCHRRSSSRVCWAALASSPSSSQCSSRTVAGSTVCPRHLQRRCHDSLSGILARVSSADCVSSRGRCCETVRNVDLSAGV